jgi:hypothetical protein
VDFNEDRGLFRTFAHPFEASYEDAETTSQIKPIDLSCSDELWSKFKEDNLLNVYKCLPKDKYLYLWQKAAVCASLFGSTSFVIDEAE